MRLIGHVDNEPTARQFSDYLLSERIANRLEHQPPEGWAIWVEDEDKLAEAASRLSAFRANPSAPEFRNRSAAASAVRSEQERQTKAYQKRMLSGRDLFRPLTVYGMGPLTLVLILASVAVFVLSNFGRDTQRVMALFISDFAEDGHYIRWLPNLPEIQRGQIWRLITPIFIHSDILHIFFNMWWLRDLGSMIEGRLSTLYLGALVLIVAVGSNLGQYYLGHGPAFGGMSGVVYGLLGYIWLRGKFDPASGLFLHPTTVTFMAIWFVVCWTGLLGAVANMAHTGGLVIGMVWGYLSGLRSR